MVLPSLFLPRESRGFPRWRAGILATLLVVALVAVVLGASPAVAQVERYQGQPIREIEYEGLNALPPETLEHYLFGRGGGEERVLDLEELDQRIKVLWDRELIDDIDVEAESVMGGVKLIVRVAERPILMSIDYVGMKRVNRSDINEQIDRERIAAYESQPLSLGEMQRLKLAIEDLYKEKGFRFAEVSFTLEDVGPGQKRAIFTIDEGNKVKIGDIQFDGNTVFGDWKLRRQMKKTKESGLITRFSKKDIYNPANLDEDLGAVREIYRKVGYKDVLIAEPEISVDAKRPDAPTIAEQKRRLILTVPIEEGDRWRLGELLVEGNEVFTDEVLLRQFESPKGGWLRSKPIDDALESIDQLYKSVGYIFAQIRPEVVERDNENGEKIADVIFHVDERDQFRVGRMEFKGNTKTKDKVLRRTMFVQEGTVMNMSGVQNSLLRVRQLNYFALDEEEPVKFDFNAEEKLVNLEVQGEEAERTELQFGGGFSEIDGFFTQFAIRTTNFRGRGETLGLSFQSGRRRDLFDVEYRIPWFLDRPQNVGIQVFQQSLSTRLTDDFVFERNFAGASFTYGRSLRGFNSLSFTYSFTDFEDVQTLLVPPDPNDPDNPPDPNDPDDFITVESNFKIASIRPAWRRNTLDSRFEPTRGLSTQASIELAGDFLGGESEFIRPIGTLTYFKPIARKPIKSSLGINIEAGFIETIGDSVLFPQQRFFLGGESSIRGHRSRSIFVRDEDGNIQFDAQGIPLGGTKMVQVNLEYHLITGGPFRVVLFGDGGGVFSEEQSIDPSLMRFSAGVELRVMVPLFPAPLRFIWANNLDELPGDRFESFDFSLSTSF